MVEKKEFNEYDQCRMLLMFLFRNLTETKNCIKEKLSGCDPLQYIMAKYFMVQNIQNNALPCNFLPDDPPSVLQVHYSINQCQQVISMATDVTKSGLCTAIGQYVQCITSVDQSELPVLWRGILGRNALLWQKRWYLDCQLTGKLGTFTLFTVYL